MSITAALVQFSAETQAALEGQEHFRRNLRETFDAMCAMRDNINEHIPMPSLESDLLQGPENSIFCATVAEAVIAASRDLVPALIADRDRLAAEVERLTDALKFREEMHESAMAERDDCIMDWSEAKSEIARLTAKRDAAMAGLAEPVAWRYWHTAPRGFESQSCWRYTEDADLAAGLPEAGIEAIPLYSAPQPAQATQAREITVQEGE